MSTCETVAPGFGDDLATQFRDSSSRFSEQRQLAALRANVDVQAAQPWMLRKRGDDSLTDPCRAARQTWISRGRRSSAAIDAAANHRIHAQTNERR